MMSRKSGSSTVGYEPQDSDKKLAHKVFFDQRVIIIKPQIDASDKEIHFRNNMLNAEKKLKKYIDEEGKGTFSAFVPTKLG